MTTTATTSSSSSTTSRVSITSFNDASVKNKTLKFVCSYGGKILPRYPEGKLRYIGGETRVLAVDSSVTFADLLGKMGELCGWGGAVRLRCQMPTEDMDALVSITSDEDLANLVEEYDLASRVKIRAILHNSAISKGKTACQPDAAAVPTMHHCGCVHHNARFPIGFGNLLQRQYYPYHQQQQCQYQHPPVHHWKHY